MSRAAAHYKVLPWHRTDTKPFFNAAESAGGVKTVSRALSSWGQTDTQRNFIVTEKRSYSFHPVIDQAFAKRKTVPSVSACLRIPNETNDLAR